MKIEKINENQIRCTLNKDDLSDRQLRISELAYGTEKAKELFRDMMQQASYEVGFEADDIPLMIEAIPVSSECLVLVITKVEDPEELDTRFSKFSSDQDIEELNFDDDIENDDAYADEIINCVGSLEDLEHTEKEFIPLSETVPHHDTKEGDGTASDTAVINIAKVYSFHQLSDLTALAKHIVYAYDGLNSVYKDPATGIYYLIISKTNQSLTSFNKICNIVSEYGKAEHSMYATFSYYEEHFEPIIKDNALQVLLTI